MRPGHLRQRCRQRTSVPPCRESGAAAASESGIKDCLDDFIRSHLIESLVESHVTVSCYILIDVLRIDLTAVPESHSELIVVEGRINVVDLLTVSEFLNHEIFINRSTADDVLIEDPFYLIYLNFLIEDVSRMNYHDRSLSAESLASCLNYLDLILLAGSFNESLELIHDLPAVVGCTSCTSAYEDVCLFSSFCSIRIESDIYLSMLSCLDIF